MSEKIVVANWKMFPPTLQKAEDFYRFSGDAANGKKILTIICPPFVFLEPLSRIESGALLGAQNCHWEKEGAFTGEVSPAMLKNLGVRHVIVGHSERRWIMAETDETINKKVKALFEQDLTPILAIGERKRDSGYEDVILNQLGKALEGLNPGDIEKLILAYEPVWAIGTGVNNKPENTVEVIGLIRGFLKTEYGIQDSVPPILYGGSVNSKNIESFASRPEIAGVLVGGASIDEGEFKKIVEITSGI